MKRSKLMDLLEKAEGFTNKNSPAILTGVGVFGVLTTAYLSYKSGIKASKIIEEYKREIEEFCPPNDKESRRVVIKDSAKKMLPVLVPPIIMGGATIASIIGSHSVSTRRIAVLSAAYSLSETTVKNLNGKMEEMLGERKATSIRDAIMKDKLKTDSTKDQKLLSDGQMVIPGDGTVLCKDLYSGRLFYSSAEKIKQAIAKCSYDIVSDMYISLNELYEAINSPQLPGIPLGDDLGWNVDDTINGKLPITLTALLTEDGKPCLCVDYDIGVRNDFRNLH